jgi:ABC-2 type transport system ATP-binding protein
MRQALGIVCAFQHDPELLILDEPTTGLDPLVRDAFLQLVRDRRDAGRTVFLSSHVLDEIERCADRVGFVHRSRLLLVEGVAELKKSLPRSVMIRRPGGAEERFTHSGDPGELLRRLAAEELEDVVIRPPSLEEIFRARVEAGDRP